MYNLWYHNGGVNINNFILETYKDKLILAINDFFEQPLTSAISEINSTILSGNYVYIAGNGGSAAMSEHFATDWSKGVYEISKSPCRVKSLTSNGSLLTAIANDLGYENSYLQQLKMFASPGDLLVLISSSGNSKNILSTLKYAEKEGINYIFLTSSLCNSIQEINGTKIIVSSKDIQIIEDVHNLFGHLVYKSFSN